MTSSIKKEGFENPIKLTFKNISYEIEVDEKKNICGKTSTEKEEPKIKKIINNVSGYAAPGQAMFIMGASGAGKSTLLNILSDRIARDGSHRLDGEIMINDSINLDR